MSYCSEVKSGLFTVKRRACCHEAYCYGLMLFGRSFSIRRIAFQTGNGDLARHYGEVLHKVFGADVKLKEGGKVRPTYTAEVETEADRLKIMASYDYGMSEDVIAEDVFRRDCCVAAFLRGAFLACGSISDPAREYRVDFLVKTERLAKEFCRFLADKGFSFTLSARGNAFVLYTKSSAQIEDFLTLIGASDVTLDMMNTKIYKSFKNKTNRLRNCDDANISKSVEASIRQRRAIEYLEKTGLLYSLPEELIEAAVLRKDNPDATLKELCALSKERLTVSGLNHRLAAILEIYEEVKK